MNPPCPTTKERIEKFPSCNTGRELFVLVVLLKFREARGNITGLLSVEIDGFDELFGGQGLMGYILKRS